MAKKQMRLSEDEIRFISCIRDCDLSADDVSCILLTVNFPDNVNVGDLEPILLSWHDKVNRFKHIYFRDFMQKGDA